MCPAGDNCENQGFTKRLYAETEVVKTADRGWGLKANQPLKKVCTAMNVLEQLSCRSITCIPVAFMVSESDTKDLFVFLG